MFTRGSTIARLATGFALAIATTCGAAAQIWQVSDGGMNTETGRGGVKMLAAANGYISVGSTDSPIPGNLDVYVVETNLAGGIIWQSAYDFGGTNDEGFDIVELAGGGFAVTGTTTAGAGGTDVFIMTINAGGGGGLVQTYGGPGNDAGLDILQSAINGNLVVAGFTTNLAGNQDALLIRTALLATPCAPAPVFANSYAPPGGGANDYFRGLWEATVGGPGVAVGDLIACGGTNSFAGTTDGLVMRTTALGVPIWTTRTGGPGVAATENFNSVIQLTVGAQIGNVVAAGSTTGTLPPSSLYMAKFNGVTGAPILPDVAGGPAGNFTEMFSVRENVAIKPGNLILAGHTNPGLLGADDAYAVEMVPAWGCPAGKVWSREYGGTVNERFNSGIEANTPCFPGYIFCGLTTTFVPVGDPQNMYLVKTDNVGVSGCNEIAPADGCATPNYPTANIGLPATGLPWGSCKLVFIRPIQGNILLCLTTCTVTKPNQNPQGNDGIAGAASNDATASANAYPNPVIAGNSFTVQYTVDKTSLAEAQVMVSDITGKVMYDQKVDASAGGGQVSISTSGWPVGTYLVKLGSGSATQTKRIVVMDK